MPILGVKCTIQGSLREILARHYQGWEKEAAQAVEDTATELRDDLRAQVSAAGLGEGLAKAWQMVKPNARYKLAALVYSKSKRLHAAFDRSFTIQAKAGHWLVIPLPAAIEAGLAASPRNARARGSIPAKWSNVAAALDRPGGLRFVALGGGRAMLVAPGTHGGKPTPMFLLLKQTTHKKLLDRQGAADRALARLRARVQAIEDL